jgi:hypothetical protein
MRDRALDGNQINFIQAGLFTDLSNLSDLYVGLACILPSIDVALTWAQGPVQQRNHKH